jgi:hypothetical protein
MMDLLTAFTFKSLLQSVITAHNQWLPKTPFLTGIRVSSLLLWLTWLCFRICHLFYKWFFIYKWIMVTDSIMCPSFITLGRTKYRSLPPAVPVLFLCFSVAVETCSFCSNTMVSASLFVAVEMCVNSEATLWLLQPYPLLRKRAQWAVVQQRMSLGVLLWLHTSSVQASCHIMLCGRENKFRFKSSLKGVMVRDIMKH